MLINHNINHLPYLIKSYVLQDNLFDSPNEESIRRMFRYYHDPSCPSSPWPDLKNKKSSLFEVEQSLITVSDIVARVEIMCEATKELTRDLIIKDDE